MLPIPSPSSTNLVTAILSPLSVNVPNDTTPEAVTPVAIIPAASKSAAASVKSPAVDPSAVVVAAINLSADWSQPKKPLLPSVPLSYM